MSMPYNTTPFATKKHERERATLGARSRPSSSSLGQVAYHRRQRSRELAQRARLARRARLRTRPLERPAQAEPAGELGAAERFAREQPTHAAAKDLDFGAVVPSEPRAMASSAGNR